MRRGRSATAAGCRPASIDPEVYRYRSGGVILPRRRRLARGDEGAAPAPSSSARPRRPPRRRHRGERLDDRWPPTTATRETILKTAVATYPHTKALKDGTVTAPGHPARPRRDRPDHRGVPPHVPSPGVRRLRDGDHHVPDGRAYGKAFTALPVFVMRQFHHSPIVYNVKSGVASPKDLEGKKVGVRAYTVTTGVWARGILATEYGVDLDKVTWVVVDEEHVQEYRKAPQRRGRARARTSARCWRRASWRRPSAPARSTRRTSSR